MTDTENMSIPSEDEFQPVYKQDEYELASESTEVSAPVSPARRKQRDFMEAYLLNDNFYHKMVRGGGPKDEKVGMYSTSTVPGALIRDAITGATNNQFRVGSVYEDLFFKVVFATGEFGSQPKTAYFDSPEQYERHLNLSVSQPNKDRWTNKFAAARKALCTE
jgi:hypothetical protein